MLQGPGGLKQIKILKVKTLETFPVSWILVSFFLVCDTFFPYLLRTAQRETRRKQADRLSGRQTGRKYQNQHQTEKKKCKRLDDSHSSARKNVLIECPLNTHQSRAVKAFCA